MTVLKLQDSIVYGPVQSRRLGRSLGVNVLPTGYKLCSFDCIYCHYGRTEVKTCEPAVQHFPSADEVLRAVQAALSGRRDFDVVTLSGNGEPTLHPDFPAIAAGVRRLRDRHAPHARLTLLSNATTAHRAPVRDALAHFDLPILKLDGGDEQTLARVNRPVAEVGLGTITAALGQIPNLVIQSVIVAGHRGNSDDEAVDRWLATLAALKPQAVQIYSTDRPVAETGTERVPPPQLQAIAQKARERTGLAVEAFWPGKG